MGLLDRLPHMSSLFRQRTVQWDRSICMSYQSHNQIMLEPQGKSPRNSRLNYQQRNPPCIQSSRKRYGCLRSSPEDKSSHKSYPNNQPMWIWDLRKCMTTGITLYRCLPECQLDRLFSRYWFRCSHRVSVVFMGTWWHTDWWMNQHNR